MGLSIALLCIEGVLRFFGIGYGSSPLISHPTLHHVHSANYRFVVYDPAKEWGGHVAAYDNEGLVIDAKKPVTVQTRVSRKRIALMGDSFVEATQLPFEASFSGILAKHARPEVEVKNYATSSYSPVLYLLQWKTQVRQFNPTHVFLLLFSGDIREDAEYSQHAVYNEAGELVAIPGPGNDWWKIQLRKSYTIRLVRRVALELKWRSQNWHQKTFLAVGSYVEENPEISDLSAGYVLTLEKLVKDSGARFILMIVPSKYRIMGGRYDNSTPEFSDEWKEWARQQSIEFLDLVEPFRLAARNGAKLFFDRDIHFNRNGHQVVARVIQRAYPDLFVQ